MQLIEQFLKPQKHVVARTNVDRQTGFAREIQVCPPFSIEPLAEVLNLPPEVDHQCPVCPGPAGWLKAQIGKHGVEIEVRHRRQQRQPHAKNMPLFIDQLSFQRAENGSQTCFIPRIIRNRRVSGAPRKHRQYHGLETGSSSRGRWPRRAAHLHTRYPESKRPRQFFLRRRRNIHRPVRRCNRKIS